MQDLCLDEHFLNRAELVHSRCVPNRGLEEDRKSVVTNTGMVSDSDLTWFKEELEPIAFILGVKRFQL